MQANKFSYPLLYLISILIVTSLLISCSKDNKTSENKDKKEKLDTSKKTTTSSASQNTGISSAGKEIFYKKSTENNIACADCHSDGSNTANTLTKYFSNIQGADKRASTYNGKFTGEEVKKNAGGATICWESYLKMKTPMTEDQIKAVNDYYAAIGVANSPTEIKYETIALPVKDKTKLKEIQKNVMNLKGDAARGEQVFTNSCGVCHGENTTIRKVPSVLEDFEGNVKSITFNVRLGDGAMPFFKTESLSDQDIADISAYIMQKSGK